MKRMLFLAVIFVLLTAGLGLTSASRFAPLSIPGYTIAIPEDTVLPDRDIFVLTETRTDPFNPNITMYLYRDPEKVYIDEYGEFIYPYMEMTIKAKAEDDAIHLLKLSFINASLEIELYENKAAFGAHQDELMKITHIKQRKIREFLR